MSRFVTRLTVLNLPKLWKTRGSVMRLAATVTKSASSR